MAKSKSNLSGSQSVLVSSNLQLAFIFFLFLAQSVSGFVYFWNILNTDGVVSTEAWMRQVLYLLFPAILVGVAYAYTPKHKTVLNRLFVATLKAVCAFGLYIVINAFNNQLAIVLADSVNGLETEWAGSFWNMVMLMSATFAGFVGVLHFWMYNKRSRRWR